jgi:hypothetical protein
LILRWLRSRLEDFTGKIWGVGGGGCNFGPGGSPLVLYSNCAPGEGYFPHHLHGADAFGRAASVGRPVCCSVGK